MPKLLSYSAAILSLCLLILLNTRLQAQQKNFIDQPYLEVTGEADTMITPDQVFLSISISERDTKNRVTTEELETKMTEALQKLGIDVEKKLTVVTMISDYRDYLVKKTDVMKSKRFELEVATAEMATNVLTTLESLEISNVRVTRLDHTRMKDIENEVRVKCITIARKKAEALVMPLQQKIGKAIHIAESPQADAQPSTMGSALSEVVVTAYSTMHGNKSNIPEINFRKLTVNKIVYVKFSLQ